MEEIFKVIALGGVEEAERNSYIIETKKDMILIDAGSANFTNKNFGVDMILPDFSYVIKNKNKLRAIFISHGHVDQMGALNNLLKDVKVNVFASKYTIKFLKTYVDKKYWELLKEINYYRPVKAGELLIHPFSLSHAIFGNFGYVISNKDKKAIVYATDYNFDQSANRFARTDINEIVNLAKNFQIQALLTESISADKLGNATGSKAYIKSFERIIEETKGRLIIGLYSSNLAGMTTIIKAAEKYNKKIVIIGRDLLGYVNIAREEGYLEIHQDIFARISDIDRIKPENLIIVVSGLYSEPFLELIKMSQERHDIINIDEKDTVLIACKPYDEIESFAQSALDCIARTNCLIKQQNLNAPSHAHQEDIKLLINLFNPKFIIPIKGEYRKLKIVKDICSDIGINPDNCYIINTGEILHIYDKYCLVNDKIELSPQLISMDDKGVSEKLMLEREVLGDNGYVIIELIYYKGEQHICQKPIIISGGLSYFNHDQKIMDTINKVITNLDKQDLSRNEFINKLRNKLSRILLDLIGKTPLLLISKVEINKERIKA